MVDVNKLLENMKKAEESLPPKPKYSAFLVPPQVRQQLIDDAKSKDNYVSSTNNVMGIAPIYGMHIEPWSLLEKDVIGFKDLESLRKFLKFADAYSKHTTNIDEILLSWNIINKDGNDDEQSKH